MAKKTPSYREIIADIKKGVFAPIYILHGKEAYYLDMVCDAIEKYAISDDEKDFNCNIFYGADADLEAMMAIARQFPMMAQRRLVILKEAQGVRGGKTVLDKLSLYAKHPSPTTVFVVVYKGEPFGASSALIKASAAASGIVFNSPEIKDYQLAGHVHDYCASKKITIQEKALAMLTDFLGSDLAKVFGQIDKMLIAAPKGTNIITPEMVEQNVGVSKDYNNFELLNALASGNYVKAMTIATRFGENMNGHPLNVTIGVLFSFYRNLTICLFAPVKTDQELLKATGLKSAYSLRDIKTAMRNFTPHKALACIDALRKADVMSKGVDSLAPPDAILKNLVFELCTLR